MFVRVQIDDEEAMRRNGRKPDHGRLAGEDEFISQSARFSGGRMAGSFDVGIMLFVGRD